MKLIIRQAKIIDQESTFHQKTVDLKIVDGIIEEIAPKITAEKGFEELILENLHISQGWFDSSVSFGEPGYEERETIANGLETAGRSGFTGIALQPNSNPITDNHAQISYLKSKSFASATEIFPIGALTKKSEGTDLAELFDMKNAGAIAFGDYNKDLQNPNLLKIALQYVQDFNGLVITYCQDEKIKGSGVANEGLVSTTLGLKGIPALAEELQIARNLYILEYTGGRLHIPTISTAKSVQLIKEAKSKGLNVTCSVSINHLLLTDEKLSGFDTRFKITPPLRSESDRKALLKGVANGTIDMITSDHNPIDIENKKMEFDLAKNGSIGLESAFGALLTVLPLESVVNMLTSAKAIFNLPKQKIAQGEVANLTFFNPDLQHVFTKESILSKSKNSALLGVNLKGKAYGILNRGQLNIK